MFYEYSVNSWTFIDDFFNLRLHQSSRPPKRWCPQVTVEPLLMATKALEAPKISCFNQHTKITHINYRSYRSMKCWALQLLQVNIRNCYGSLMDEFAASCLAPDQAYSFSRCGEVTSFLYDRPQSCTIYECIHSGCLDFQVLSISELLRHYTCM